MLVAQRVNDFISSLGAPVCDGCVVKNLSLSAHAHAAQITAALGTTSDFVRREGRCAVCDQDRMVIKRV